MRPALLQRRSREDILKISGIALARSSDRAGWSLSRQRWRPEVGSVARAGSAAGFVFPNQGLRRLDVDHPGRSGLQKTARHVFKFFLQKGSEVN